MINPLGFAIIGSVLQAASSAPLLAEGPEVLNVAVVAFVGVFRSGLLGFVVRRCLRLTRPLWLQGSAGSLVLSVLATSAPAVFVVVLFSRIGPFIVSQSALGPLYIALIAGVIGGGVASKFRGARQSRAQRIKNPAPRS